MSEKPKSKNILHQIQSSDPNCYQWISVAAYYKAEARDFKPGKEWDDWFKAEIDYIKYQIKSFLVRCEEDGGISLAELQELGRYIRMDHPERINTEKELIQMIQKTSKHRGCFQSEYSSVCEETDCQWRAECQKLIADWFR